MCRFIQYAVPQRHSQTGCIPTGYEFLLRSGGIAGIDFSNFQEDFDLQLSNSGDNNFHAIKDAVILRYPQVRIEIESFQSGIEKTQRIDELLTANKPSLISLTLFQTGGWHIMPVLGRTATTYHLLHQLRQDGIAEIQNILISDIVYRHDNWPGGNDIAFLN